MDRPLASASTSKKGPYQKWTEEELAYLLELVRKFKNAWDQIHRMTTFFID